MTDVVQVAGDSGLKRNFRDNGDSTFAEEFGSQLRAWDATSLAWVKLLVDHNTGALSTGGGAGGGAVTMADGANVALGTTTDLVTANTVVGILKAIKAAVQGTLTVATHAVTQSGVWTVALSANTPDVTDRAARLLGHVTVDTAPTTAITAAALPLPAGAATAANQSTVKAASALAAATDTAQVVQLSPQSAQAANLCVTVTAATGVAATLTLPAAAAGLFHYISLIEIQLYATAARTGGATPVLVTTTNLPGSPVWDFDTAQAIGVTIRQATQPATSIKSSAAATPTTIVAPIATTGIWRITAYYYTAP